MRVSTKQKLRTNNKTSWDVVHERDAQKARLLNYKNSNRVEVFWDLNDDTIAERLFLLKVGKEEAIISAEELRRFIRWV